MVAKQVAVQLNNFRRILWKLELLKASHADIRINVLACLCPEDQPPTYEVFVFKYVLEDR